MTGQQRVSLATLLLIIGAAFLLSGGIGRIRFSDGYRIEMQRQTGFGSGEAAFEGNETAFRVVAWIALAGAVSSVLVSLRTRNGRRRVIGYALITVASVALIGLLGELLPDLEHREQDEEHEEVVDSASGFGPSATRDGEHGVFESPPEPSGPPPALPYALAIAVAAVTGAVAYRLAKRSANAAGDSDDEERSPLSAAAERARMSLSADGSDEDLVRRSYRDLEHLASTRLGHTRAEHLSPRACIETLVAVGLPRYAVEELVTLFEDVRYGTALADENRESRAREALAAIIAAADECSRESELRSNNDDRSRETDEDRGAR